MLTNEFVLDGLHIAHNLLLLSLHCQTFVLRQCVVLLRQSCQCRESLIALVEQIFQRRDHMVHARDLIVFISVILCNMMRALHRMSDILLVKAFHDARRTPYCY